MFEGALEAGVVRGLHRGDSKGADRERRDSGRWMIRESTNKEQRAQTIWRWMETSDRGE